MGSSLNSPEEWLKYIMNEKKSYRGPNKYKYWLKLYRRATNSIPADESAHNNNAYAKIMVDFAKLTASTSEDDARMIFQTARANVKHCSLVYVAWAQFELLNNNRKKCKKILEKGKIFCAKPEHLLNKASENFESGCDQLIDDETEEHTFTELINKSSMKIDDFTGENDLGGVLKHHTSGSSLGSSSSSSGLLSPEGTTSTMESLEESGEVFKKSSPRELSTITESTPVCMEKASNDKEAAMTVVHSSPYKSRAHDVIARSLSNNEQSLPAVHRSESRLPGDSECEIDSLVFKQSLLNIGKKTGLMDFATPNTKSFHNENAVKNSNNRAKRSVFVGLPQRVKNENRDHIRNVPVNNKENDIQLNLELKKKKRIKDVHNYPRTSTDVPVGNPRTISHTTLREDLPKSEPYVNLTSDQTDRTIETVTSHVITPLACAHHVLSAAKERIKSESTESRNMSVFTPSTLESCNNKKQESISLRRNTPTMTSSNLSQNSSCSGSQSSQSSKDYSRRNILTIHEVNCNNEPKIQTIMVNGKVYTKVEMIGRGGSSEVYTVFDGDFNQYALKYVDIGCADSSVIESYVNEITLLKKLQGNDSIIKLYEWEMDEVNKVIKIVLERGNSDLASYIKKNPEEITIEFIKTYWRKMLDAVDVIHKQGIIHTDLKPANFLLVACNQLKLIDFGIANAIQGDVTSFYRDSTIGTLSYMSPEALKDVSLIQEQSSSHKPLMKIGRPSDVWSLGCILYLMVYGKTPFQHIKNSFQKWSCIVDPSYEIKFPHIENKDLLDSIKGCLRRNPSERYTLTQLKCHPFITGRSSNNDMNDVLSCLMRMQDINSPRKLKSFAQNLVGQLSSGRSLDIAAVESNLYSKGK